MGYATTAAAALVGVGAAFWGYLSYRAWLEGHEALGFCLTIFATMIFLVALILL